MAEKAVLDGSALALLADMVECQGGDPAWVYDTEKFPKAPYQKEVHSPADGFITYTDTEEYGLVCLALGAGRSRVEDKIDHSAGIYLARRTGDAVKQGDVIATLYTSRAEALAPAEARLLAATVIGKDAPAASPLVLEVIE